MASGSGARAVKSLSDKSLTVQLVVPASALSVLENMTEVIVTRLISKCEQDYPEVTCNITGPPEAMLEVLQICSLETSSPSAPRLTAPSTSSEGGIKLPAAHLSGKIMDLFTGSGGDAVTRAGEAGVEQKGSEVKAKSDPSEKKDDSYSCTSSVKLGDWKGCVTLSFQWDGLISPYSEYLDPDGSNWWTLRQGSARRAVAKTPKSIQLEWRQGMSGKWEAIDAPNGKAELTVQPETISQMNFNGFQSRWIVDGERYLHSLARVPTLLPLLVEVEPVASLMESLPPEKRKFESLKDPTILDGKPLPKGKQIYDAIMMVENIIPQNTWDIVYSCKTLPGRIEDGKHEMSLLERAEFETMSRLMHPRTLAEIRKEALRAPIRAALAAVGSVGVPLPFEVDSLDIFVPSCEGEDVIYEVAEIDADDVQLEYIRRLFQDRLNASHPAYLGGVRVSLPSFKDLKSCLGAKRPSCSPRPTLPVLFEHVFNKADDYCKEHSVSVKIWLRKESYELARTFQLKSEQGDEPAKGVTAAAAETAGALLGKASSLFGGGASKPSAEKTSEATWKRYTGCVELEDGEYSYVWVIDDLLFFNNGLSLNGKDAGTNHCVLTVQCGVRFGIGVQMP